MTTPSGWVGDPVYDVPRDGDDESAPSQIRSTARNMADTLLTPVQEAAEDNDPPPYIHCIYSRRGSPPSYHELLSREGLWRASDQLHIANTRLSEASRPATQRLAADARDMFEQNEISRPAG